MSGRVLVLLCLLEVEIAGSVVGISQPPNGLVIRLRPRSPFTLLFSILSIINIQSHEFHRPYYTFKMLRKVLRFEVLYANSAELSLP